MDDEKKDEKLELTPEEQTAEAEAQKEVNTDELKDKIIEKYGLDPETQADLVDKLVEDEKSHREKLSGAIKQKIKWREAANKTSKKPETKTDAKGKTEEVPDVPSLVSKQVKEELEKRDLESLTVPDEVKEEIKDWAKFKGISVREAAKQPYILSRIEQVEREARINRATPKRSNKGSYTPSVDPSKPLNPEDFKTADGNIDAKAWNEAKAMRERHLAANK